jgi:hypothetical protein
MDIWSFP